MGKLLFYHFQVTNSSLKNKVSYRFINSKLKIKKFYFELLIRQMKKNLDLDVTRYFYIKMKYYTTQSYLEKYRHVGFCGFRY